MYPNSSFTARQSKGNDHNEKLSTMKSLILKNLEKMKNHGMGGKSKSEYISKQEKTVNEISDRYEEAKQIADKTFEIVENQLSKLENYVENDINEKRQIEDEFSKNLSEASEIINMRFEQETQSRVGFEKKFRNLVSQRFDLLKNDLNKEIQMRNTSINNIEQSIENDFDKVDGDLKEAAEAAEQTDNELNKIYEDLLDRVTEENEQIKKEKNATEEGILDQLKQVGKIKDEITEEKRDRENVEETLLSLLESTCGKLQNKPSLNDTQMTSPQKVVQSPI